MSRQPRPSGELPEGDGSEWYRNRPHFQGEYMHVNDGPATGKYLEWIASELDRLGLTVAIVDGQPKITGEPAGKRTIPGRLLAAVKRHREEVLTYYATYRGLDLSQLPPPLPPAGSVVEWVGDGGEEIDRDPRGICTAEDLRFRPWVRWRIRGTKRWYAQTGDSWED